MIANRLPIYRERSIDKQDKKQPTFTKSKKILKFLENNIQRRISNANLPSRLPAQVAVRKKRSIYVIMKCRHIGSGEIEKKPGYLERHRRASQ